MTLDRRAFLVAGPAGLPMLGAAVAARTETAAPDPASRAVDVAAFGVSPGRAGPQTAALQAAIDAAAERRLPLRLAPGPVETGTLTLRPASMILGTGPASRLLGVGNGPVLAGAGADAVHLSGFALAAPQSIAASLIAFEDCAGLRIDRLVLEGGAAHAIALERCGGAITACAIAGAPQTGIFSRDGSGLEIASNAIADCGNNAIQVWRSAPGVDASLVTGNRISRIRADAGGSGENGNGINLFRADGAVVSANVIADCAFSAIRANAASDCQIVNNSCARLGEVAIYAEFGFSGALVAANLVVGAATGISITNFNEGGRLAVVSGNIVRNLSFRDDPDRRGIGIGVEADTVVTGNVVEAAPAIGIALGWGAYLRDVVASNNVIRGCPTGIAVQVAPGAGAALISANLISGATEGAIRAFEWDRPVSGDLVAGAGAYPNITLAGNVAA